MPAAAVIRGTQALSGITGRKELRRWFSKQSMKAFRSTEYPYLELLNLSIGEVAGIPGVGVKSVDIGKNTDGVSRLLAYC